ncbi:MAG TPA: hypothetical protein PKL57_17710, partial [Candidatus Wallbacteria bacterium]|nr:hypothetical protein [Candidatus Wallbacteria bacterium]
LDIGEGSNNETLTKYETWVYASSSNSSLKFTYAADMIGHLFLNGEALADDYNLYNYGKNYVTVPLGKFAKQGWNHLAVYVLHQQHPDGNTDLNGICYKLILPNDSTVKAFNDSAVVTLWNSFPTPQPYLSGLYQKGRGTAIVVYDLLTDGTLAVAKSMDGPAIEPAHCGVFFADPLALSMTKIYARKPFEGGDHKTSIGIISYEDFNSTKIRFRTDDAYGDEGFIKFHVEQKPYIPNNVNRINIANPTLVCSGDYVDVESIATLKPQLSVLESPNKDPDNFGNSKGFHHSLYYDDYRLPKNPDTKREDEVRYVYAISDNPDDIEKRYPDMNWSYVKYKAPANLITLWNNFDFASYLGPTHIVNSGFTAADEARNVNGVISPIFYYKVWAIDEHGFLQEEGSPLKRFCIDLSPPVVRDIQVYYDKEGIRLDEDKSMFVENDQSPEGTLSVALVGHTLTLWAFCTDEITADPRKFKDAKFYVRKHGSTDPWFEIDATCEVDTDILYQDIKFAFQKTPPKHPNNYLWFAFYTIPYNADLTSYDVDFQVADALGNRSAKLSESADEDLAKLTKKQFSVATLGFKNVTVPPKSNSSVLNVAWQSFEDWRKCDSVSHYIVSIGDLTPNPFETSNWVDGSLRSCTREVRIEGKIPVFVMPVE